MKWRNWNPADSVIIFAILIAILGLWAVLADATSVPSTDKIEPPLRPTLAQLGDFVNAYVDSTAVVDPLANGWMMHAEGKGWIIYVESMDGEWARYVDYLASGERW